MSDDEPLLSDHGDGPPSPDGTPQYDPEAETGEPPRTWARRVFPAGYWPEFKGLWSLALPIMLTNLSDFMICVVAAIFCGHLGKRQLAASALANSMINVTGLSIAMGLSSACDTLFSQIYGSNRKEQMGVVLQRSLMIIPLAVFPCWAIHLNAQQLLVLMGQDATAAKLTGDYLLLFFPGLLAVFIAIPLGVYLQSQNIVLPGLVIGLAGNVINAVLHYVLLFVWHLDTNGSAIAQSVSYVCVLIGNVLYILISGVYKETWTGWSRECLLEWGPFCRMGLMGLLMDCIEWWTFEVGIYLTGLLGTKVLDAQSVVFQFESFQFMIPLGLGMAASVRVGQYLGEGNAAGALTSARVAITVTYACGLVAGAICLALKSYLPYAFTKVPEVVELVEKVIPIISLSMMFDITATGSWILKGSGRQKLGAIMAFFTFSSALAVAIPLLFKTTFGYQAFWLSLVVALFMESIVYHVILHRTDWDRQVELAAERTSSGGDHLSNGDDDVASPDGNHGSIQNMASSSLPAEYTPEVAVSSQSSTVIPTRVILNRLVLLGVLLSIFGAGLAVRLRVPVTVPFTDLCSTNRTLSNSTDIPICKHNNVSDMWYL